MPEPSGWNEREVGRVVSVSNFRVRVLLDPEVRSQVRAYPEHIAMVSQIGGYVVFPVAPGESCVGIVVGAAEDEAIEPDGEKGMTLHLAKARRTLTINLLGQLIEGEPFVPGVSVYPRLDAPALLPTEKELGDILEYRPTGSRIATDAPLELGVSPIYARKVVTASYNDIFARPLGVIGNTGSGKSYTVASAVQKALRMRDSAAEQAKIIILDINGEYSPAFPISAASAEARTRELNRVYLNGEPFHLPLWLFNLSELVAFFEASQASQVPVLERVVAHLRERSADPEPAKKLRDVVRLSDHCRDCLGGLAALAAVVDGNAVCDNAAGLVGYLKEYASAIQGLAEGLIEVPAEITEIEKTVSVLSTAGLKTVSEYRQMRKDKNYDGFRIMAPGLAMKVNVVVDKLEPTFERLRLDAFGKGGLLEVTADSPIQFPIRDLERDVHFRIAVARFRGQERIQEYIATLRLRIHRQLSDKRWDVFTNESTDDLAKIVERIIGGRERRVTVVDCSMLAHDVLPFFCSIFGRLLLELRAHAAPAERTVQPYVLILEEAHNYLKPRRDDEAVGLRLAREAFERIAKEGRKFGLSLVIASQRPSDVSATVLSQCANFVVHRIQNPEDIDYFKKILPTGSRDLLDQLPILAPGDGLLLGSAVNVPARIKVNKPSPEPSSETPRPWDAWQKGRAEFNMDAAVSSWSRESRGEAEVQGEPKTKTESAKKIEGEQKK